MFGEVMGSMRSDALIRYGGAFSMSLSGSESNVAIGLARLGHRSAWAGKLGADDIGSFALRTMRGEGVDTRHVAIDRERQTGIMLIENRVAEISRVAYYRAGSAGSALGIDDLRGLLAESPRVLHVTGITPALSVSAAAATEWAIDAARQAGILVSFDVNHRSALWTREAASSVLSRIARRADIVFASGDELSLIAPGAPRRAAASLIAAGVGEVVSKRAGQGAVAWRGDDQFSVPARRVRVIDTIGAGDAFTAGYLSAWLDGLDIRRRLTRGAVLGAFAVSGAGDWEHLPTRDELSLLDVADGSTTR